MKILVINCGSSSLKYQVLDMNGEILLAKGLVERIGMDGSVITHEKIGMDKVRNETPMESHKEAIQLVLDAIIDPEHGVVKDMSEIGAVGHRVVHAGEKYASSVLIDDDVIQALEECVELAPLHNPPNLLGIAACQELMPNTPMVGVFDTAFHQTMPPESYIYAIPYEYYQKHKIRRYGFHGTSHKFVAQRAAAMLNTNINDLKIITCHLGNGASVTAIKHGRVVDTSMGFTPLEGLVMGTRCGSIDPSVVFFLCDRFNMSVEEVKEVFNKKSGLLALSGISSDMRPICEGYEHGEPKCTLAMDMFCYRLAKFISSYYVPLGRVDAIVFSGGIGENCWEARKITCAMLKESLGIEINEELNEKALGRLGFEGGELSTPNSKVKVFMIPTNEELVIARSAMKFVK